MALKIPQFGLSKRPSAELAKPEFSLTVGALEQALLREFPLADAEEWDRTGVTVGDKARPLQGVALALDPTVAAIEEAAGAGANVLVTHHPAFLEAPDTFAPAASAALNSGAAVWAAIEHKVALMSYHTALDVSPRAARVLPDLLGLSFKGAFAEPLATNKRKGYGQVCSVRETDAPFTLGQLAARCTAVFGRAPRVWGDFTRPLQTVVTCTGSAASTAAAALKLGAQCVVCGEIKYHAALDLSHAGLSIIELGHDVSELPLVGVLAEAVAAVGVPQERLHVVAQGDNWQYPETVRV